MTQFCQTGRSKEIPFDAASQCRGSLMKAVNECLGILVRVAESYHHESQGLVERCGVFERMLQPFIADHKHDWDNLISYLMFAYRDVVNAASAMFSPRKQYTDRIL